MTELESQLKHRIQQRMGDASRALFENGEVSWKRSKDSVTLDTARPLKDQPHLLTAYAQTKPGSRRFIIASLTIPYSKQANLLEVGLFFIFEKEST